MNESIDNCKQNVRRTKLVEEIIQAELGHEVLMGRVDVARAAKMMFAINVGGKLQKAANQSAEGKKACDAEKKRLNDDLKEVTMAEEDINQMISEMKEKIVAMDATSLAESQSKIAEDAKNDARKSTAKVPSGLPLYGKGRDQSGLTLDDADEFMGRFEAVMLANRFPKERWVEVLPSRMTFIALMAMAVKWVEEKQPWEDVQQLFLESQLSNQIKWIRR